MKQLFEDDPKWNGPVKIDPSECFISTGPGDLEGKYYPVLMKPRAEGEELNRLGGTEHYMILGKMLFSFDTAREALYFAAKTMTAVPILIDDKYKWPYFSERGAKVRLQAAERRVRRNKKFAEHMRKSKNGHHRTEETT